ncbi:GNAT family N-acetyltransferase [Stutzerimonas nitrititolerans]|uniref:GNAT family N-acetyltransferase n=1 Tax=Stutzerimonas nitrititolerans TaxID=2482751 RepID=UPI0028A91924|nr:GNAT family N-acetyltransferase [Stutzerimonas nitrititolerans]
MFLFEEADTDTIALEMSNEDPDTPFPEILVPIDEIHQCILIIEENGTKIGFALIADFFGSLQIHRFFIRPAFRERGIGTSSASALVAYLRTELASGIDIEATDERAERMWRRALADFPYRYLGQGKFSVCGPSAT